MCDPADGTCVIWERTEQRARKPHRCYGCGETIPVGKTYAKTRFLFDGSWGGWKHCRRCDLIFNALQREVPSDVYVDPGLDCGETWQTAFGEPPPPDIASLAFVLPEDFAE